MYLSTLSLYSKDQKGYRSTFVSGGVALWLFVTVILVHIRQSIPYLALDINSFVPKETP